MAAGTAKSTLECAEIPDGRAGSGRQPYRGAVADQKPIECWMTDMDGVLVHEGRMIPGADAFVARLREAGKPFLVLTNNSIYTPRDLQFRLRNSGIDVPVESIWTSALATATFLDDQRPQGSAYVVGEAGLTTALHEIGYVLTDNAPDYVVLGETRTYSFTAVTTAIRLIRDGARFVATNPDATGPSEDGVLPATGAVAALMTRATGVEPYYVGKPNPLMMRAALNRIQAHSETTAMVGDRMDTDIVAGLEAGMRTVLVLTGIVQAEDIDRFPTGPTGSCPRSPTSSTRSDPGGRTHAGGHTGVDPGPVEGGDFPPVGVARLARHWSVQP